MSETATTVMEKLVSALKALRDEKSKGEKASAETMDTLCDEAWNLATSDEAKGYGAVPEMAAQIIQLRADVDDAHDRLRKDERRSLALPLVVPTPGAPGQRPRFRFSHPELSRGFAELAKSIRDARRAGREEIEFDGKALTPNSDAEGGYAIPDAQLASELEMMVESAGVAGQIAGVMPLPAGGLKVARRLSGAVAEWKTPGAEGTPSTPTFGTFSMAAETLFALIETDVEFEEDTAIQVGNYLATEFAYAIADEEDRVAFVGTGIGTDGGITGILNSTYVTIVEMDAGEDAFTDLDTMDYLVDCEAAVWDGALANAHWLVHRTVRAIVKKIKDSAGLPIWQPPAAGEPGEIIGYPHLNAGRMRAAADSAAETTFLAFGDFRRGLRIGRRGQMRIDWSRDAGFRSLQNVWRCYERLDMGVMGFTAAEIAAHSELANPIAVLKTGTAK